MPDPSLLKNCLDPSRPHFITLYLGDGYAAGRGIFRQFKTIRKEGLGARPQDFPFFVFGQSRRILSIEQSCSEVGIGGYTFMDNPVAFLIEIERRKLSNSKSNAVESMGKFIS